MIKMPFIRLFVCLCLFADSASAQSRKAGEAPQLSPVRMNDGRSSKPIPVLRDQRKKVSSRPVALDQSDIPESLRPWIDWVQEGAPHQDNPRAYDDADVRFPVWASRLSLEVTKSGGSFSLKATAFEDAWLSLPGGDHIWPTFVQVNGEAVPILEREGRPAVRVGYGAASISGAFVWNKLPQKIKLPAEVGLLELSVNGEKRENPSWESDGTLWLERVTSAEKVDEDFLSVKAYSMIADGIPLWFETQVELIVAGKSREEVIGSVLPKGWSLASIESPIPVAIDDSGLLRAQLRAGRWAIRLRSFETKQIEEIAFTEGVTPITAEQPVAFQARPNFRQAEIVGLPQIDVAQTQVPDEWRSLPIYRWETDGGFQLVERVRGAGERGTAPLEISRRLWLDDDGKNLTYQDTIAGSVRETRRLDTVEGQTLGSIAVGGEPQLVTHNPTNQAPGFELRSPNLSAVATGRIELDGNLPASGWNAKSEDVSVSMQLPPGYRLLALFGADYVSGAWLSSWTLLDLFILLLFSLALFRVRGIGAALLGLCAFGLAYHELGSPKLSWLFLLIPVALVIFMPKGKARATMQWIKWGFAVNLLLFLLPFLIYQIQGAVFPQLERSSAYSTAGRNFKSVEMAKEAVASAQLERSSQHEYGKGKGKKWKINENLIQDTKAVIQTGPGVPDWRWREVRYGWDGPVAASQEVRPILISPPLSRLIAIIRLIALLGLFVMLVTAKPREKKPKEKMEKVGGSGKAALAIGMLLMALLGSWNEASAQFPQAPLLEELRDRLADSSEAFPGAAEIAAAKMRLDGEELALTLDYHAADRCAVIVPFPSGGSAVRSATWSDGSQASLLRKNGHLLVLLPEKGIHQLTLDGRLRNVSEWEWGFALKPRRVTIETESWNVSGIRPDGSAEDQILFTRLRGDEDVSAAANYDHPETSHVLLVERELELGLVWRVITKVTRLSPKGRAVVMSVPILSGEKVVSGGLEVKAGQVEVRLPPNGESVRWEGELAPIEALTLSVQESAQWTEQWKLVLSPVWNVEFSGLHPTFIADEGQLVPFWQPWPSESTTLSVSRPKAVAGAVVTVDSVEHVLRTGRRQHSSSLELEVRTSLGEDFPIELPAGAEVTQLKHANRLIPVRKEGNAVVVPLRPGPQSIMVKWQSQGDERGWTRAHPVKLPVESANVTTIVRPSTERWIMMLQGPLRGPAVRFWGILLFALLGAVVLSRVKADVLEGNPLGFCEWILLCLGLTQVSVVLALIVIAWLFFIQWRGSTSYSRLPGFIYNAGEVALIIGTLIAFGVFISLARSGLLGTPDMYIAGGGSSATYLKWFSARSGEELPQPGYGSVSIWWYRLAMLLWALWLAWALVKWVRLGWKRSEKHGHFKPMTKRRKRSLPPSLPRENKSKGGGKEE